ncbi:HD-GYP domain-containing protein [Fictibacillus phosphorivorans]|uniref:HD-GYP domain-containing protein n=1 Tax=Fictibacillus phosphorivorans TaxID=1221500 RepID=UPI001293A9DC|nr:HD-GYP domain-containing protein [Fictibacillus phosphorivorans]MQR93852.1 HD-GYP domain-containing protein [Fictibacillus phosphorivorans]
MIRNIKLAQLFIIGSALVQTLHHFFIEPIENFYPFLFLFLIGFLPAWVVNRVQEEYTKLTFVLCSVYIVSISYYFITYPIVQAAYFFLPVTALLLNDKRLYYVSSVGGLASYLFLSNEPLKHYLAFVSIYVTFGSLLFMAQRIVYQSVAEKEAIQQGVKAFSLAVEAKDVYTQGHSKRVALYAMILAKHGQFKNVQPEELELTALIHDIGKISTPDAVLLKNGRLTEAEYEIMKKHPVEGMKLAKSFGYSDCVLTGILHHHERYDGLGYPYRLKGKDIPIYSRILAVADSFDAMTSNRAYRQGMTPWEAKKEIENQSGKMYDPFIVEVFIRAYYDMLLICEDSSENILMSNSAYQEIASGLNEGKND